ncbi:MAG: hypothetical protein Q9190_002842 [Brigantiaea leucoxantha]
MLEPILPIGPGYDYRGDPLKVLQAELSQDRVLSTHALDIPNLTAGAVGYLSYDCIKYFEPKVDRPLKDNVQIPEALFMLYDTVVAFDHFLSTLTVVTHIRLPEEPEEDIQPAYDKGCQVLWSIIETIQRPEIPLLSPPPENELSQTTNGEEYTSNVGRRGYEGFVTNLKEHIVKGDIIQAVPSQRISRKTTVHPFNIYRTLRTLNPSPYMFFLSCSNFSIIGASPECLMKTDGYAPLPSNPQVSRPRILNHAIAGTIARGNTAAEDDELAGQLQRSKKDRAEHVMLVDLARNDVNRVCDPLTVRVDRLMRVDRYSHVQHLTSEVSGLLRPECTRWDALRSIFPCGTVSGAPKIRAVELVYDLEQEKRGVYAGAVGWFGHDISRMDKHPSSSGNYLVTAEGPVDTCIAIRTMFVKDGTAYLQAGGGIVYDSDETDEWIETMNKLAANLRCIELAERRFEGKITSKTVEEIIEKQKNEY